ncbi:MAG: hypothetical protein ACPGVB_02955 [Chitinophagales bacterium]
MKQTNLFYIFLLLVISMIGWTSCNTTELNPAYIYIEEVKVASTFSQGANTHKITTIWAFVDNQPLGVFELPALIPILKEGQEVLVLQAGINNNGVSADRVVYPFYKEISMTLDFQPLETDTIIPTFEYTDSANFAFVSDFDAFGNFFEGDIGTTSTASEVLTGSSSGKIQLMGNNDNFIFKNNNTHELPVNNQEAVYLEVDYKCTHPFEIFIEASNNAGGDPIGSFLLFIAAREDWNKIYIDLTNTIAALKLQNRDRFRIIFDGNITDGESSGTFFWDNIKLIYQQ